MFIIKNSFDAVLVTANSSVDPLCCYFGDLRVSFHPSCPDPSTFFSISDVNDELQFCHQAVAILVGILRIFVSAAMGRRAIKAQSILNMNTNPAADFKMKVRFLSL